MLTISRRIEALEARTSSQVAVRIIILRDFVKPGRTDLDPIGMNPVSPYLPQVLRGRGEDWDMFVSRWEKMLASLLPPGKVVLAIPSSADSESTAYPQ